MLFPFFLRLFVKKEVSDGASEGEKEVVPASSTLLVADGKAKERNAFLIRGEGLNPPPILTEKQEGYKGLKGLKKPQCVQLWCSFLSREKDKN